MSLRSLSRRSLLRGLGVGIALPWLEIMQPRLSASHASPQPLRTLFFNVPNGAHMPAWTPSSEGTGFELTPILSPLSNHRKQIHVFTGLTLDNAHAHGDGAGDHARSGASFLTGAHPRKTDGADIHNGVSVDQVLAHAVGNQTRFASLELGLEGSAQAGNCDSGYSCAYSSNLAWRNETSPLAKESNPSAVFDRLFGGEKMAGAVREKSLQRDRRKSILDLASEDAKSLQRQLGSADQKKLDEYLYAVRDVEKRMTQPDQLRVGEDGVPNVERPAGVPREWQAHCRLMMDMIALAIQTDSTRIITFMFANEGSNRGYPEIEAPEGHHDLSHHGKSAEKQSKVQKINTFHMTQFAYLLDRLAPIHEDGAPLLDHCLLLYGSGISDGDRHNHNDLPILVAGGSALLGEGSHRRFPKNTPLCNLYLWMLHQAGVSVDTFGDSKEILTLS